MEHGTVSWFDETKGYGFIIPDTKHPGHKDFFVHRSNVETDTQTLEKGDRVEFEIAQGSKNLEAKSVRLIQE